ncbi:hypothetical protein VTK56DRAFT_6977 [Thermocarpiscus australiensis]
MCFVLEEEQAMFTGDNVLGHGTAAVGMLPTWMQSLRAMQAHGCGAGYPAHGDVIRDLPAKIATELAAKERREKRGSVTVRQLVTAMYCERLDEQVREKAIELFTEEVLRKLAGDGKAAFELKAGQRRWFANCHCLSQVVP